MTIPSMAMKKRTILLFAFTGLFMLVLLGRLFYIQLIWGTELREEALNLRMRDVPVEPKRGTIYDRHGRKLAIGVNADTVFAVPTEVKNPEETAMVLSAALSLDYERVLRRLTKRSSFEYIKREISDEESRKMRAMDLPGIYLTQESKRYYPKGNLASHVLGIVGIDNEGLEGIEITYDRQLRGVPGRILVEYDARGRQLPQTVQRYMPPEDGHDLFLTIDEVIQYIVERELDKAMAQTGAKRGIVIAMNPATGEILAMANRPDFDPNRYADYPVSDRRNIAIVDTFSPGSSFKPITAAAALEEGAVSASSGFYCPGYIKVPGAIIGDVSAHGSVNFYEAIQRSCNVALATMGLKLGAERFYKYLKAFQLLDETGIDLPGEAQGIMIPLQKVKPVDIAVMSFGQTLTLTPLQLITAVSAIANKGVLMRPYVAKALRSPSGQMIEFGPVELRRILSENTAREVTEGMERVILLGTGKRAWVEGYRLAGKTGTAQKVVGGRVSSGVYTGVFVGFGPVENPVVALLVMLDEPAGAYYGGVIAAPVFSAVMKDVLRYLDIPPDPNAPRPATVRRTETRPPEKTRVPSIINLPAEEAARVLKSAGLILETEGKGRIVLQQTPPPGVEMDIGSKVIGFTEEGKFIMPVEEKDIPVTVPSLTGLTLEEAARRLGEIGLRLDAEGTGTVSSQDPPPGTRLNWGDTVKVKLE